MRAEGGSVSDLERAQAVEVLLAQASAALVDALTDLSKQQTEGRSPQPLDRDFVLACLAVWDHPAVQFRLCEVIGATLGTILGKPRSARDQRGDSLARREFLLADLDIDQTATIEDDGAAEIDSFVHIATASSSLLLPVCPAMLARGASILDVPAGAVVLEGDDPEIDFIEHATLEGSAFP